jgi:hypothetical protein
MGGEMHQRSLALVGQARDFGEVGGGKKSALFAVMTQKFRQNLR